MCDDARLRERDAAGGVFASGLSYCARCRGRQLRLVVA